MFSGTCSVTFVLQQATGYSSYCRVEGLGPLPCTKPVPGIEDDDGDLLFFFRIKQS